MQATLLSDTPNTNRAYSIDDLIAQVRAQVANDDVEGVQQVLEAAIGAHPGFLPDEFLEVKTESYARRLIYADPGHKFSILAMVWNPGQGTPLHDHGGLWVVESVYRGHVDVANYDYLGQADGLHQFAKVEERHDGPGVADRRLPPEEHHVLRNIGASPAVTIHVFGGDLVQCNIFEPEAGGYRKLTKSMSID